MQTIKKNWVYFLFVFSVVLFVVTRFTARNHSGEMLVTYKTFNGPAGWGYNILTNDTIYIHQEFIPAIEGRKGFSSEEDAEKVAKLALAQLKYKKLPTITLAELDSCGIKK